jgi:hypothetical protein
VLPVIRQGFWSFYYVMEELKWLISSFSLQRPRFDSSYIHLGFFVDKVSLEQVFLYVLSFSPVRYHSTKAPCWYVFLPLILYSLSTWKCCWVAWNTKHVLDGSFIKPTHARLTYITIQFFVYSFIFQWNCAIFNESIHQYLKLTKM